MNYIYQSDFIYNNFYKTINSSVVNRTNDNYGATLDRDKFEDTTEVQYEKDFY